MAKKYYFTQNTEDNILLYLKEEDSFTRNKIYRNNIDHAFNKLAENLIHTYKFYHYEDTYEDLKHEVITFFLEKLNHFNPDSGKAYSFFTKIGYNYLVNRNNTTYKGKKEKEDLIVLDDNRDVINEIDYSDYKTDLSGFFDIFAVYLDENSNSIFDKKHEIQIAYAVLELFKNRVNIENFNKKALYIMIREMTNAKTHDITKVVNIIKKHFISLFEVYKLHGSIDTVTK